MRPSVTPPMLIRGIEYGGPRPLFCIPLVAGDLSELLAQAEIARRLQADLIEWRVDSFRDQIAENIVEATRRLRSVLDLEPIVFTLRASSEGGKQEISQNDRAHCIDVVLRSGLIDIIDVELANGPEFLKSIIATAHEHGARVMLSFHDFEATPSNDMLSGKISTMIDQGADIAKIACMPREPGDVLRLLQVTLAARQASPAVPLCTMSMGAMGCLSRVAGFLFGSDMSFAIGQEVSAPGQLPIAEARAMAESLLRYA